MEPYSMMTIPDWKRKFLTFDVDHNCNGYASLYSVTLDGALMEAFTHKQKAKDYARWLDRHPATKDRRLFGHGGVVGILDQADPDVCQYCGILVEDCGCIDNWM